ncbi:MAG: hypothetical protein IJ493_11995 [Clostridia bacterium]|nr:hypothetical protein [Clostridia bacterium]
MTAAQRQTVKVYIADFRKCTTRTGFYRQLSRAFGVSLPVGGSTSLWKAFCQRIAVISAYQIPVRVRLVGLENIYSHCREDVDALVRVLRAAGERSEALRCEAIVGDAKWPI